MAAASEPSVRQDDNRFDSTSWATIGLGLLVLSLSLALTWYRLSLPTDGRAFFDEPEPGLTLGGPVLVSVEGVPVEQIIWGAVTLRPLRPANWEVGQTVSYTYQSGGTSPITLRPSSASFALFDRWLWYTIPQLVLQLLVGLFVFFRRPRSQATQLLFLYSLLPATGLIIRSVTQGWNEIRLADYFYRGAYWPALLLGSLDALRFPILLHFFLIFPTIKLPLRRHPYLTLAAIYGPGLLMSLIWSPGQPFAFLLGRFSFLIFLVWMLFIFGGLILSIGHTFLTLPDPVGRAQMRWVAWGIAIPGFNWLLLMLVFLAAFLARELGVDRSLQHPLANTALELLYGIFPFTALTFPLALAIAILRYRLFEIDRLLNRTLVYSALLGLIAGLYILIVGTLGVLFQGSNNLLISILATGLIAALFQPLRQRLQRLANRLLYGDRDDPATVLTRLGQGLEAAIAPKAALSTIVATVAQALKLPYVAIALRHEQGFELEAAYPPTPPPLPAGDTWILPLVYQGETVGQLRIGARAPGEPLTPADRRLLANIAHQAGAMIHAIRLAADLQRSRERLVAAREEERRRLRRDLHDGLGPQLASQILKLDAARNLLAQTRSGEVDQLLVELKAQTQAIIGDIRRLVYDLRPPALDQLGLAPALREQAAAYQTPTGLHISVDLPELLPPLPAAVEVAAYRIVLEALANVAHHAQANECLVRLRLDDMLRLEVIDDGIGLAAGYQAGVGLSSMRERAVELGGNCRVESLPQGGTRVLAELPLIR